MNENQYPLYQNLDQNTVERAMQALLILVSKQHKEIRKMEKLMTPQRATEFIHKNNYYKNKEGQEVQKKNPKYELMKYKDYDGDGLEDTIVTQEGKVYSFNGYMPKDSDYPSHKTYLSQNNKCSDEKTGKEKYTKYSMKNMKTKDVNPQNPQEKSYALNLNFINELAN
jgi:hypothetical protein